MPDSKISGLTQVSAFAGTQEFAVNDSGTSRKITGMQLIAAVAQGTLSAGYAQVTANQGTFTAETDLTGLTVTVTTVAGRRYRLSGFVQLQSTVAADDVFFNVKEGATYLGQINFDLARANFPYPGYCAPIITPSAGSHTYKLSAARNAGTGNITMVASPSQVAFISVEDIGV